MPRSPAPRWDYKPDEILGSVKKTHEKVKAIHDGVAKVDPGSASFENVFGKLAEADALLDTLQQLFFCQYVHSNEAIRNEALEAEKLNTTFTMNLDARADVYRVVKAASEKLSKSVKDEQAKLIQSVMREYKRNGMELKKETRDKFIEMVEKLAKMCKDVMNNSARTKTKIPLTAKELDGLPETLLTRWQKNEEGAYDVPLKPADILQVLTHCKESNTRKKAFVGHERRLEINAPILDSIFRLRDEIATLLGYDCWVDFVNEDGILKTADSVAEFLGSLEDELTVAGDRELNELINVKKMECFERRIPIAHDLNAWDFKYYERIYLSRKLKLDTYSIMMYFPANHVLKYSLKLFGDLFNVYLKPMKGATWGDDVMPFEVWEKGAQSSKDFIGYLYFDLYSRPEKSCPTSVLTLIPGYDLPRSGRNNPSIAVVSNFRKTDDKNPLFRFENVSRLFHLLGHAAHMLFSKAKFSRFGGAKVSKTFVEGPGFLMEYLVSEPKVLKMLSRHVKTGKSMPDDMIEKIEKSRFAMFNLLELRNLFLSKYDHIVHSEKDIEDYTLRWNDLRGYISLVFGQGLEGLELPGQANFLHLVNGFDASYFCILYSTVYSFDIYDTMFKKSPLDPGVWKKFREVILQPGASGDEEELLKTFLGREHNPTAYFEGGKKDC